MKKPIIETLDQRVREARLKVWPEEPLGYVFVADEKLGGFRVHALTAKELGMVLERGQGRATIG